MATRSITFVSPAAGWVQVSPVLPAAGGVDVTNLPDVALREMPGRGTYSITWDDEGWSDWSASGAVSDGGSVQTTSDLTPAGIQAMLEASAAKTSAKPSGGAGSPGPAGPPGPPGAPGRPGDAGPSNLQVLENTQPVPPGTPANTVLVRKVG